MEKKINDITIEAMKGNIVDQKDISTVVNAANAQLRMGGGVAGAIHRKAGSELEKETRDLAPISPGEAVITGAHKLPNKYIIHVLGPVYGRDKPEPEILASCYRNALNIAEKHNLKSIAFPAISTGAFGYPIEDAAEVAFNTILAMTEEIENVKLIRFVLYSDRDYEVHKIAMEKIMETT